MTFDVMRVDSVHNTINIYVHFKHTRCPVPDSQRNVMPELGNYVLSNLCMMSKQIVKMILHSVI